jgi:vesicle coat complex subunit
MKDMNSKTDMYRANAIRVLCRIIDSTLLTQIERYLKQAIVDKNPVVASAALVSGIYLLQVCPAVIFVLLLDILLPAALHPYDYVFCMFFSLADKSGSCEKMEQ